MKLYNAMDFRRSYLINMSYLTMNADNHILNTTFNHLCTHLRLISSRLYSLVPLKRSSKRLTEVLPKARSVICHRHLWRECLLPVTVHQTPLICLSLKGGCITEDFNY